MAYQNMELANLNPLTNLIEGFRPKKRRKKTWGRMLDINRGKIEEQQKVRVINFDL